MNTVSAELNIGTETHQDRLARPGVSEPATSVAQVDSPKAPGFAEVTAIEPLAHDSFAAALHGKWSIGGRLNGGYLLAILGRAARAVADHEHVIAASAHYLRSPEPGPVNIAVEQLRTGRSATQVRARMSQAGDACVEALITLGHLVDGSVPYWNGGLPEPAHLRFDKARPLKGPTPNGIEVALLDQVDLRLDPGSMGFAAGTPSGIGELAGWLRLANDEPFDSISLLFAVDSFPPATFDISLSGWVPTLELTAYIRATPAPGPLRVLQRAGLIHDQRVDETCFVWDSTGRLVAQATQLAGIRLG